MPYTLITLSYVTADQKYLKVSQIGISKSHNTKQPVLVPFSEFRLKHKTQTPLEIFGLIVHRSY